MNNTRIQLVNYFDEQYRIVDIYYNLPENIHKLNQYKECIDTIKKYQELIYQKLNILDNEVSIEELFDSKHKFVFCHSSNTRISIIQLARYIDISLLRKSHASIGVMKTTEGFQIENTQSYDKKNIVRINIYNILNNINSIYNSYFSSLIVDLTLERKVILTDLELPEDILSYFGQIDELIIDNCVSDLKTYTLKLNRYQDIKSITLDSIIYHDELELLIDNTENLILSYVHLDSILRLDKLNKLKTLKLIHDINFDRISYSDTITHLNIVYKDYASTLINYQLLKRFPNLVECKIKVIMTSQIIKQAKFPYLCGIASELYKNNISNISIEYKICRYQKDTELVATLTISN